MPSQERLDRHNTLYIEALASEDIGEAITAHWIRLEALGHALSGIRGIPERARKLVALGQSRLGALAISLGTEMQERYRYDPIQPRMMIEQLRIDLSHDPIATTHRILQETYDMIVGRKLEIDGAAEIARMTSPRFDR